MSLLREVPPFQLPATPQASEIVARYFRVLSDPTRLRILELLRRDGELTVEEIVGRLAVPQPQVSNHLTCLRRCGFIRSRRDGRTVYNRINDERIVQMLDFVHALRTAEAPRAGAVAPTAVEGGSPAGRATPQA